MDMQQVVQLAQHLEEAAAAIRQTGGSLPPPALERLDKATRETLKAVYRARGTLKLPAVSGPSARQSASHDATEIPPLQLPRRSRRTAQDAPSKRTKSEQVTRSNAVFFQQMNLSPALDALPLRQEGTENAAGVRAAAESGQ
jgi:hypothetical protein